jgi:hypothetical protein
MCPGGLGRDGCPVGSSASSASTGIGKRHDGLVLRHSKAGNADDGREFGIVCRRRLGVRSGTRCVLQGNIVGEREFAHSGEGLAVDLPKLSWTGENLARTGENLGSR